MMLVIALLQMEAEAITRQEAEAEWSALQKSPLNEAGFRKICDLIQATGQTDINYAYQIMGELLPKIEKAQNQRWKHIVLMTWAKAELSFHHFPQADSLFRAARLNAAGSPVLYNESLVGTILLCGEQGQTDSLNKYADLAEINCTRYPDPENMSFVCTFRSAVLNDTAAMRKGFEKAIALAGKVSDKNALFTAKYNYANVLLQNDLTQRVKALEDLLQLTKDPSLNNFPPKMYERTTFSFRNPVATLYYQLMQLNMQLSDYTSAGKFADLLDEAAIKPNPNGPNAPYFNAEIATVRFYQGNIRAARQLLELSRKQFSVPEEQIPYLGYYVAAGLLAKHDLLYDKAEKYFAKFAADRDISFGFQFIPVELHYAHSLTLNRNFKKARLVFEQLKPLPGRQPYTAAGYYYYRYLADFLKATGHPVSYSDALEQALLIRDSLTSINQYRSIQQIMGRIRIAEKEQQLQQAKLESAEQRLRIQKERFIYGIAIGLSNVIVIALLFYVGYRNQKEKQRAALQQLHLQNIEKQNQLTLLQGIMQAGESERRKIADQLHDDVNSMLALASLSVSSVLEKADPVDTEKKLENTHQIISEVSEIIRNLSHQLHPLTLEKYGFGRALLELTDLVNSTGRLTLETIVDGFEDANARPGTLESNLYQIIQELIQNIIRHSQANLARLEVTRHRDVVSVILEDNGRGIFTNEGGPGQGISSIKSRIAFLEGKFEVDSKPGQGTTVVIEIPLPMT